MRILVVLPTDFSSQTGSQEYHTITTVRTFYTMLEIKAYIEYRLVLLL